MGQIRELLNIGHFFLLYVSLSQVHATIDSLENHALKNLNFLIIVVIFYEVWKKRNGRFHKSTHMNMSVLAKQIRLSFAHKLRLWKFKHSWRPSASYTLEAWIDFHI